MPGCPVDAHRQKPYWRQHWTRVLGLVALVLAVGLAAADRAAKQHVGTDFHVFWQAGYDFAHGLPLYHSLEGARSFIYPPFAAQVFQVLGFIPLKTAAWLFYVASVALIIVAVRISHDIVQRIEPERRRGRLPLVLAFLFSANFMLDNLDHVQVNVLTFVLCLLGIRAFVERRELAGGGWLAAATAIKLTPMFFVVWALVRGSRRSLTAVCAFAGVCLTLPILQRGLTQGLIDLTTYYQTFLHKFTAGAVITNYRNQNLAAMVYRAVTPMAAEDVHPYDYAYLPSLATTAPLVYRTLAIVLLAVFLGHLIRLRLARRPVGALEIASVFLAGHLLSGITWKAHLVTLLFVFYAFLSLEYQRIRGVGRMALGVAWAGMVTVSLGRDVIGSRLHHYLAGYSVFVWVLLLLFMLSIVWSQRAMVRTSYL
jgi:hypothetical protein